MKVWKCTAVMLDRDEMPDGADQAPRAAVRAACVETFGQEPDHIFSSWGEITLLDPSEMAVILNDLLNSKEL